MNLVLVVATLLTLIPGSPPPAASCSTPDIHNRLFETYENSDSPDLIKKKLDALVLQLQADKAQETWLVSYAGQTACRSEAKQRAIGVKNYLLGKGIRPERIKIMDAGYREEWSVELWLNIKGLPGPSAGPTLNSRDVRLLKRSECDKKYKIGKAETCSYDDTFHLRLVSTFSR